MNLLPHILRKDLRHFYPEILINLALLIAFTVAVVYSRAQAYNFALSVLPPYLLRLLIPIAWLILISRLIHDESLVGDRQFWITRPYSWPTLLLEKALFLLAFLHLPLLLMQMYLIHTAGFPIAPSLGHLLAYQLWVTCFFDLPLTAIGVLSATLTMHILGVIGGIVYILALVALGGRIGEHDMPAPALDWITSTIVIATLLFVIVFMYARRQTRQLRLVLLFLPPALLLLWLSAPAGLMIRHAYAAANTGDQFIFDPNPAQQEDPTGAPLMMEHNAVSLRLPLRFQPANPSRFATTQGAQVTLRAPDGFSWTSAFQASSTTYGPGDPAQLQLSVPLPLYQRLKSQLVTVHLEIATQTFLKGPAQTLVTPPSGSFSLPDGNHCHTNRDDSALVCYSPLWEPPNPEMIFEVQNKFCGLPSDKSLFTSPFLGGSGGLRPDLDPIVTHEIGFYAGDAQGTNRGFYLCPGAHIRIAAVTPSSQEMLTLSLTNIEPARYTLKETRPGNLHGSASVGFTISR